jgi:fibronectin type 3 domain-containing protein
VPVNLEGVADAGFITLTWDAVKAQDLRGYLVLRREGSNDRLQQLTPEPITQTAYQDTAVRPGATYEYAVVAIDQSTPANKSAPSAFKTVTAR